MDQLVIVSICNFAACACLCLMSEYEKAKRISLFVAFFTILLLSNIFIYELNYIPDIFLFITAPALWVFFVFINFIIDNTMFGVFINSLYLKKDGNQIHSIFLVFSIFFVLIIEFLAMYYSAIYTTNRNKFLEQARWLSHYFITSPYKCTFLFIFMAFIMFFIRENARVFYAGMEFIFGVIVLNNSMSAIIGSNNDNFEEMFLKVLVGLASGVYIIIRSLDNFGKYITKDLSERNKFRYIWSRII
ncbi:UNVERIFIED_CONTAM: hypothetical protein JM85_2067 [Acetobacter peroxydans]